jgi:Protein of unknown function (DUF3417)
VASAVSHEQIERVLGDLRFRKDVDGLIATRRQALEAPAWFQQNQSQGPLTCVAYFSMELMLPNIDRCLPTPEQLVLENLCKRLVMKNSSPMKRREGVPYSDRWWTTPEPLLCDFELKARSKLSNLALFPERIRVRWKASDLDGTKLSRIRQIQLPRRP